MDGMPESNTKPVNTGMDAAPNANAPKDNTPEVMPQGNQSGQMPAKKPMAMWIGLAVVVLLLAGGGTWWLMKHNSHKPAAVTQRYVKIGVIAPLQSDYLAAGQAINEGTQLANKELTYPGLHVTLVQADTNCDGAKAIQAMKDFQTQGVVAVVGEVCSSTELAVAPTANELKIPMVSPSATNPDVSQAGDYLFRVIPSDAFSADFTAKLLYARGLKKLAVMHGNEAYGNGLNTAVSADFVKAGGTVVDSQVINNEDSNVTAQVTHIKAAQPDAIYIALNGSDVVPIAILQKMKDLGMTTPVFTSETLKDPVFIHDAGALAEGVTSIAVSEGSASFIEKSQAAYNKDPDIYSAQAYDAYEAIFKALSTGANTGEQIKDALYKVNFTGATGQVKFDSNGDVPPNFTAFKVENGKYVVTN